MTATLPPYSEYLLSNDKVVAYLIDAKNNGWCEQAYQEAKDTFVILLPGDRRVFIFYSSMDHAWRVDADLPGWWIFNRGRTFCGAAISLPELETALAKAVRHFSTTWPERKTNIRLHAETPASNIAAISKLVGTAEVQGVFDPYLDNNSLSVLLNILSFGAGVAGNVRLLSGKKMASGTVPRLTGTFVRDWFQERGVTSGEARLMHNDEHRRFILLSGGQSLILGMSLNSIAKNEAVRLESDSHDRPFFDSVWAAATTTVLP